MPVAMYRSTVRWQSEHQLGHHYCNATIPCIKEARWGRHETQDSIVLSMSNDLLCFGAQHDTHTPQNLNKWHSAATPPLVDVGHFLADNQHVKNPIGQKYAPGPRAQSGGALRHSDKGLIM